VPKLKEIIICFPLSLFLDIWVGFLVLCRFSKIYHWFNTYGKGHTFWPVIHKHERAEKSVLFLEGSVCWEKAVGPCCSNLTKSFWLMLHNPVDNGKAVRKNTQVLCLAWLCLQYRNEVTLSSDHMNHFCVSLPMFYTSVIYLLIELLQVVSQRTTFLCLRQLCCNSNTLNGGDEYLQNQLTH